jgi:hypothetical protein
MARCETCGNDYDKAFESDCMSADEFAREIEVIGRLHVELALVESPSLH